jgi:hypothetical protein
MDNILSKKKSHLSKLTGGSNGIYKNIPLKKKKDIYKKFVHPN